MLNSMKISVLVSFVFMIALSCQPANKGVNKVEIAEQYINALNATDYEAIVGLFKDSVRMKEIVYSSVFSKDAYYTLFQWDSTFHPLYKILGIKEENGVVKMTVSKECPRILFLNEVPNVTEETIKFEDGKIQSVEITQYVVFNEKTWETNRDSLVAWVEKHHPSLNGFLYDQTKQGAIKYLEAIQRYQSRQ